jgi:phage terminase large subunit-like protein
MNNVLYYARKLLTEEQLARLIEYDVSLSELRKYVAEQSFEAFIKIYFEDEFTLPFAPFQYDMIADCQGIIDRLRDNQRGVKLARCYPRAHGKSSFYARLLPLYCFLFNLSPLTILIGNTHDAGKRLLKNIKRICESNAAITEDFVIRGEQWGLERIETIDGATIQAFGIDAGSIRGISNPQRPRLVICDDLDDDQAVRSATILAGMRDVFDKSILQIGDSVTFTTSFVVCGTLIRKTSLLQYVLANPEFDSLVAQGVQRFADCPELWQQWERWYIANQPKDPASDSFYQEHRDELLAGTQVLWDRPDAYYAMMLYRLAAGDRAFQSEIQNQPQETGNHFGALALVAYPTELHEYHLFAALDPTTKGGKSNDYAAWVEVLFHQPSRKLIVSYCDAAQRNYGDTIETVAHRIKQSQKRYSGIYVEENAAGGIVADLLEQQIAGSYYLVNQIHNTIPKHERIDVLSEYIRLGQLEFAHDINPLLLQEADAFPFAPHDDCLDALSMIVLQLRKEGWLDAVEVRDVWSY